MTKITVVHGTPGSGKTTHANRLKELYPTTVEHISIGNRLRAVSNGEIDSQFKSEVIKQADVLRRSEPINHEIVNGVVFEFVALCPAAAIVLVDGYPRFVEQLPLFHQSIEETKSEYIGLVNLQISEETCVDRLTMRGTRKGEKKVNESFARRRFNEYQENTMPTIELLENEAAVIHIDAEPPMEEVWKTFYQHFSNLIFHGTIIDENKGL